LDSRKPKWSEYIWAGWRAGFISRPGQQLFPLAPIPEINEKDLMKISEKLIALKN